MIRGCDSSRRSNYPAYFFNTLQAVEKNMLCYNLPHAKEAINYSSLILIEGARFPEFQRPIVFRSQYFGTGCNFSALLPSPEKNHQESYQNLMGINIHYHRQQWTVIQISIYYELWYLRHLIRHATLTKQVQWGLNDGIRGTANTVQGLLFILRTSGRLKI